MLIIKNAQLNYPPGVTLRDVNMPPTKEELVQPSLETVIENYYDGNLNMFIRDMKNALINDVDISVDLLNEITDGDYYDVAEITEYAIGMPVAVFKLTKPLPGQNLPESFTLLLPSS